jgi:hypothetical protein
MEKVPVKDRAKSVNNQASASAAQPKSSTAGKTRATAKGIGGQQLQKTREALLSESEIPWDSSSAEDVRKHLYMKGYSHDDAASFDTLENIAMVLLRIAAEATSVTAYACRAVTLNWGWILGCNLVIFKSKKVSSSQKKGDYLPFLYSLPGI